MAIERYREATGLPVMAQPNAGQPKLIDMIVVYDETPAEMVKGVVPLLQSGKVRILAVSTPQRVPSLPQVPTVAESGYAGFDALGWLGIVAPKGLDPAIRDRLNADLKKALAADATKAQLASMGMLPIASSPDEFARTIDDELVKWGAVIKAGHISLD